MATASNSSQKLLVVNSSAISATLSASAYFIFFLCRHWRFFLDGFFAAFCLLQVISFPAYFDIRLKQRVA